MVIRMLDVKTYLITTIGFDPLPYTNKSPKGENFTLLKLLVLKLRI